MANNGRVDNESLKNEKKKKRTDYSGELHASLTKGVQSYIPINPGVKRRVLCFKNLVVSLSTTTFAKRHQSVRKERETSIGVRRETNKNGEKPRFISKQNN